MMRRKKGKMRCTICLLISIFWSFSEAQNVQLTSAVDFTPNKVHKLAVEVLQQCFNNQKTVAVHGDLDESATETLSSELSVTVIHYSDAINYKAEHPYAVNSFLITANSGVAVRERLTILRGTPWWNSMGAFFLVPESSNRSCANVENILRAAWEMDVVTGLFLCKNSQQEMMMYTYNPFTNRAPQPWWRSGMVQGEPGRWTLFEMTNATGNVCEGMNFDRTKSLDGFEIRTIASSRSEHLVVPESELRDSELAAMYSNDARIAQGLKIALNVTINVQFVPDEWSPSKAMKMEKCFQPLVNASRDAALCWRPYDSIDNFTPSYPMHYPGYTVITQRLGFYTPLEKMWNYYGSVTVISMAAILSMTFIVVWYSDKYRRISFAGFEVLRLLINTAINTRLDNLAKRIFFLSIFFYFLIMQATFSGRISAFLTKDEERKNVERLEDLRSPWYTEIYADSTAMKFIDDPVLQKKITTSTSRYCSTLVLQSARVACIKVGYYAVFEAIKNDLHYTRRFFGHYSPVFPTRNDFPLKNRVDIALMWLEQSGLTERWSSREVREAMAAHHGKLERSLVHIRPISLQMLPFAFYILGFGLSLAAICFVLEVVMARKKSVSARK